MFIEANDRHNNVFGVLWAGRAGRYRWLIRPPIPCLGIASLAQVSKTGLCPLHFFYSFGVFTITSLETGVSHTHTHTHPSIHSLTFTHHSFTHLLPHSPTLTHSSTLSPTHSLTYSLTHSLTVFAFPVDAKNTHVGLSGPLICFWVPATIQLSQRSINCFPVDQILSSLGELLAISII